MSHLQKALESLNLREVWLPDESPNRTGRPIRPDFVTIHNTANSSAGATAASHARYLRSSSAAKRKVSWHYTVDDIEAIKHLPIFEAGMHAGSREGNDRSIGIEICEYRGIDQDRANERAALLTAVILFNLGLELDAVVPHRHWSGKNCPHLLLENDEEGWRAFLVLVRNALDSFAIAD